MIIGIDLGTTNSLVAYYGADGPVLIDNAVGAPLTPSAVHLAKDGTAIVGQSARDRLMTDADRTTAKFKRNMGTNRTTALGKTIMRPEDLSALVLKSLKADAEAALGETVSEAVISVPAYFNDV